MKDTDLDRREVLKAMGMGATALGVGLAAPTIVARTARGELLRSEQEYGGFTVERMPATDAYEVDPEVLKPIGEKYTISAATNGIRSVRTGRRRSRTYSTTVWWKGEAKYLTKPDSTMR